MSNFELMLPSHYFEIKKMTPSQKEVFPLAAQLCDLRDHMETVHGALPSDYMNDVLGWHKKNHPKCLFYKKKETDGNRT